MTEFDKQQTGFTICRSFLADLSVENPTGPVVADLATEIKLGLDGEVNVTSMLNNVHQVDVGLRLTAALGARVIFLAELTYRVEVTLQGIPEPVVSQVLCVDVPNTVFPVIQEIMVRNGAFAGYPEMQVLPLDFRKIFLAKQGDSIPKRTEQYAPTSD